MNPSRFAPQVPPQAMKTYRIGAPLATHWNTITCADADCEAQASGWQTIVDEAASLGRRQANYIRRDSGRKFTEERNETGLTVFTFEAGQRCFATHRGRNMRPERFIERAGDHRGNPTGMRLEHSKPDHWVESFAENQDRVKTMKERG